MIHKLMQHITRILIVHRSFFLLSGIILLFKGCFLFNIDSVPYANYEVEIHNKSKDTVVINLNPHPTFDYGVLLYPDAFYHQGRIGLYEENEDPIIDGLFNSTDIRFPNEVYIEWDDTLRRTWKGPARDMGDSIHHFYNYKSWVVYENQDSNNYVRFYIEDSDLIPD